MSPSAVATSTISAAKGMLHLLGFRYAEHKLEAPKPVAEVLGVNVDCLRVSSNGQVQYVMKENRRKEVLESIEEILRSKSLVPFDLPSILGRVQFADGQLTGRTGRLAMADIREVGLRSKEQLKLDDDTLKALESLKPRSICNAPKTFSLRCDEQPILVYTDGSYEHAEGEEKAMICGVLIHRDEPCRVFGNHVPKPLLTKWHKAGKEHVIGQVDLYAIVIARTLWKDVMRDKRVIMFVDNWAVLDCYIPGTAKERTWRELLLKIEEVDFEHPSYVWAARVPSESNIAHPPSRGSLAPLKFLGNLMVDEPECPMVREKLQSCIS